MRPRRSRGRGLLAAAAAALIAGGGLATAPAAAFAEDGGSGTIAVSEASFLWGMNGQYQGGNPANTTCNYFSAGEQLDYAAEQGSVHIVHDAGSGLTLSSESTKCTGASGGSYQQLVLFTDGTGTADPSTGEATIEWDGAFMANAYGGLVPWSVSELGLHVDATGEGTLTATLGGFGSSMENPGVLVPLEKQRVTLATFPRVTVTEHGIEVQPDYAGVEVTVPDGEGTPQDRTVSGWGSWPQSVVDFHLKSGLSSYWYSSGGGADPTKAAYPFTVQFDGAPEVVTKTPPPVITAQTKVQGTQPTVIGRSVTVTAAAANADSVHWERSLTNKRLGEYAAIPGQESETLSFTASSEWNGKYVRMVATNAGGTAISTPAIVLAYDYEAPTVVSQPQAVIAFTGHPVRLVASVTGYPSLVQERNRIEISHDDGASWREVAGSAGASNAASAFVIPKATADQDGALIRAVVTSSEGREAGSPGVTAVSDPVKLTVLPATGSGPQLAVVTDGPVDPKVDTTVTIAGAGYSVPAWSEADPNVLSYIDVGLFDADAWQPGSGALERVDGVTYSLDTWVDGTALGQDNLRRQEGTFSLTATIPAGTLDPERSYGVGTYTRTNDFVAGENTWKNRGGDAWAPVKLVGQTDDSEFVPDEGELTDANRGGVAAPGSAVAGTEITVVVGKAHAGDRVQMFLFSDPIPLGTPTVAASGTVRVTLPASVTGRHKIAAYTAGNALVGWDDITITAESDDGGTGTGKDDGGDSDSEDDGAGTDDTGALVKTGGGALGDLLCAGVIVMILGGAALAVAHRARRGSIG